MSEIHFINQNYAIHVAVYGFNCDRPEIARQRFALKHWAKEMKKTKLADENYRRYLGFNYRAIKNTYDKTKKLKVVYGYAN